MASRYPLVLDESTNRLRELPNGDDLNLAGNNITGLIALTTTGGITVGGSLNVSGEANADTVQATTGNITNINATTLDASTITIDGEPLSATQVQSDFNVDDIASPAFILNRPLIPSDISDLSDDNNLIQGGDIDYNDLLNLPSIPTDIQQLTDNNDIIPTDINDLTDTVGIIPTQFTDLSDTFDNYTGNANKLISVNPGETGVGFTTSAELVLESSQVTNALGFTPYNGTTNPNNYINRTDISGVGDIAYNESTGEISFINATGYLTTESDTLDTVTTRGGTTTNNITAGSFTTTGSVNAGGLTLSTGITFNSSGNIVLDVSLGGVGGTLTLGGQSSVIINSFDPVQTNSSIVPASGVTPNLGAPGSNFDNVYANTINTGLLVPTTTNFTLDLPNAGSVLSLGADRRVEIVSGTLRPFEVSVAEMNAIANPIAGEIIYNNETRMGMVYVENFDGAALLADQNKWAQMNISIGGIPPYEHEGMFAIADGINWDPSGAGDRLLMIYINGAWEILL